MRLRFVGSIVSVTLLVLATLLIPLAWYLHASAFAQTQTELEKNAFALASRANAMLWSPTPENTAYVESVARAYADASGARVVITDDQGIARVTTDADAGDVGSTFSNRPEIEQALSGQIATGERYSQSTGAHLLYVAVPALSGERVLGAVRITFPEAVIESRIAQQLSVLWLIGITGVLAAGVVGWFLASSVTRPLQRLTETADAVAAGDLDRRSDTSRGAKEIRSLALAYNRMSDRLAGLLDEQRRFAADASHQLRTPLTALRLRLESAQSLLASDPDKASNRIDSAVHEVDRLNDLIEALLVMSRGEVDEGRLTVTNVSTVVAATVDIWRPLAVEQRISLRTNIEPEVFAAVLDGSIEQIVGNLIDNAMRASDPHSTIQVDLTRNGGFAEIRIADSGRGMGAADLERAFDRFWRADTNTSGTGIGLAIVKRLVELAGGSVFLESIEPTGVRATVRLPLALETASGA